MSTPGRSARGEPRPDRRRAGAGTPLSEGQEKLAQPTRSEWAVALAGAALVFATLGYLLLQLVREPDTPPDIAVEMVAVVPVRTGYLVEFSATNHGHMTAVRLELEGTLRRGAITVETSTAVIDFLPPGSSRRAGLFFQEDPRRHALAIVPKGYQRP